MPLSTSDDSSYAVERAICDAIAKLCLVSFLFKGHRRVAEPHDYGVINGGRKLFFHQTGGTSRSAPAIGWRWASLAEISDLRLLDERFSGPRPAPSGRHHKWDRIIASVSRPPTT
jgi:hypothetical protein